MAVAPQSSPPTTGGFNLRQLIREVADQSTTADPPSIAKQVLDRIDRRHSRLALEQALPTIVQHVVSLGRSTARTDQPAADQGDADTQRPAVGGGHSWKRAGIAAWWRTQLDSQIAIGPARTDWKHLRDCTADDLDYAAGIREDLARANALAADRMRKLAEDLRGTGAETVGDLAARSAAA